MWILILQLASRKHVMRSIKADSFAAAAGEAARQADDENAEVIQLSWAPLRSHP